MKRFDGKVVLVTGAGRNTGAGIAALFIREGAKVSICASTPGEHGLRTAASAPRPAGSRRGGAGRTGASA